MSKDGVQATNYEWRVTRWKHLARGGKGRATEVFGLHWNVRVVAGTKSRVTAEGSNLFMERTGGKKVQLFPEAGDIFFRKGVEGRILFHFGGQGKVDRLIDRRNNEDVVWRRIE